ncbi:tetratricopeptide repeat protein [Geomobilimonas luticola]|uniref:Tetratricopeptide repeat protein n=1 Tax=Geomobilimonas luticola TaxID=1114878 RepID=A0ABS5SEP0_9BACT|nr:tetratricopeptide repeat protein [Geomobilimonas luticola]MBT0653835.1 tetratricopeptide repeat protein [Geomobilimonas luticola]
MYRFGCIIILLAVVYGTTLTHDFVWDDTYIIVNNPLLEKLGNIPAFFLSEDTIEESSTGYYRPVTYISFALDRAVWGVNPAGFHLTNLVLHIVAVLLFYAVTAVLFKKERLAFVAALIFALHPVAGETVNFLAGGRNTLLSACFGLLALLFHVRNKPVPALACFTAAIFSKEFALLFPAVFVLYDLRMQREKFRAGRYAPFLVPVAVYLTLRSFAVQKANFLDAINLPDAVAAPYLVARYLLNMVAPFQLKVLYSINPGTTSVILCCVFAGGVTAAVYYFRKHDEILFSAFWFLLFLLPVINIIPLHTTTMMADRYAYFSLMGFSLFLAAVIGKLNGRGMAVVVVALCAVYAAIDMRHNGVWKNDIEFFTRMTKDAPERFVGFKNLGMAYYRKGDTARAVEYLEAGDTKRDISVNYLIGDAYIYWKENRLDKAEKSLRRVVDVNPSNPEPYLLLMMIHEQKGDSDTAQDYRNKVLGMVGSLDKLMTDRTFEMCRTGETYMSKGQYADAEIYLWQALKIDPDYIPALVDMGSLRAGQGKLADAVTYFSKALDLEPFNASARYNLAMVYQMQGRTAEARAEMVKFRDAENREKHKENVLR